MSKKRSRKKSYLKSNIRRKDRRISRRISRRKDKRKIKKTRKKNKRGGAKTVGLTGLTPRDAELVSGGKYGKPEIEPTPQPEPEVSLSRLSSSRTVNVDDELLSDPNIGVINGHGSVDEEEFLVVPEGICLWVLTSAGRAVEEIESDVLEKIDPKYLEKNPDLISSKYRKYGPGSLIQGQTVGTLYTQGYSLWNSENPHADKIQTARLAMVSYKPSFILTGKNNSNINNTYISITEGDNNAEVVYHGRTIYGIPMETKNRSKIEELAFSEHDERIIPKSELLTEDDDTLIIQQIKLSELFKRISVAQKAYADSPNPIPTNWVGLFCRSGTALNIDFLKEKCSSLLPVSLDDSDFGGVTSYEQEGESQLTHQSSLSSRRVPGNFKQIVEELYELFNRGEGNVSDEMLALMEIDLVKANAHFKFFLNQIKSSIDNIEPIHYVNVCAVLQLRKLNL